MNISLHLSNGRKIALSNGARLMAADLPGLHSVPAGGPVAAVTSHPTDPSIQGLQNLSQQSWTALLANGDKVEVKPSKNVRLAPGTSIKFGAIQGEIESAAPQPGRSKAWLWAGVASAALCLLGAGGWYFQRELARKPASRNPVVRDEQPAAGKKKAQDVASGHAPLAVSAQNVSKIQPIYNGIYDLQALINFDCLDGATFDPATGGLSLFGHRANPDRLLRIPYYDYLATALDCKTPTFSLEWTPSSPPEVDRVLKTGTQAILHAVTNIYDNNGNLTFTGAWFLQQNGVPVAPGMDQSTTLAWLLVSTNRPKPAEVVERYAAWLDAKGDAAAKAQLALYKTLGVDASYRELEVKQQAENVSVEQLNDDFDSKFFAALGTGLESKENRYADQYRESRRKGRSPSEAFRDAQHDVTRDLVGLMRQTIEKLADKNSEISVPPEVITKATGGVVPHVYPVFNDLPPKSQLARIALQADVAGKFLMCAPELKERVPNYRTEFQFYRAKGQPSDSGGGYERCWISPGKFELSESPEGNTMRFVNTPMKFNIRTVSGASKTRTDVADPLAEQYGTELTAQYDALAREVPVLHDLRESVKVVALARWLQRSGFRINLPKEGRTEWSPPAELPGVIHVVLSLKGAKIVTSSAAEGGIDLNVNPAPTILKAKAGDPWADVRNDPTLRNAVAATVPTKEALDKQEQDLLEQLSKATSDEKAALDVKLSHVRAAKGDKKGATEAWEQALKDQGKTNAAYQAEHNFQSAKEAADNAALFPGAGNSLVIRNPNGHGGVMLPFGQPPKVSTGTLTEPAENSKADSELTGHELDSVHFPRFKPHWQEPPAMDKRIQDNLEKYPELKQHLKERALLVDESQKAGPTKVEEIKKQVESMDKKTKDKTEEILRKDYNNAAPLEEN